MLETVIETARRVQHSNLDNEKDGTVACKHFKQARTCQVIDGDGAIVVYVKLSKGSCYDIFFSGCICLEVLKINLQERDIYFFMPCRNGQASDPCLLISTTLQIWTLDVVNLSLSWEQEIGDSSTKPVGVTSKNYWEILSETMSHLIVMISIKLIHKGFQIVVRIVWQSHSLQRLLSSRHYFLWNPENKERP